MKKALVVVLLAGLLTFIALTWRNARLETPPPPPTVARSAGNTAPATKPPALALPRPPPPPAGARTTLSPEEKAALIEKIKRDYDEIRTKASADYSAAGNTFPGGLNAFLRQLGLLEREKRADFAAILSARELEDLEMRETTAGQLVQRLLGSTAATEEQRRAVFRLQLQFEDRFALTFDVSPAALLERESARQQTQEKIHTVLGDSLFGAWLAGEGEEFAQAVAFAARQNLPASVPLELWRTKNEFTLRRLELSGNAALSTEARGAATKLLVQQTEDRAMNIIGAGAWQAARNDVLRWLPKR